jgi:hypothetical protein
MIDEEATKKQYGYYSTDLKPQSGKKIIVICDTCGKIREIRKSSYRPLCGSCVQKVKKIECECIQCGKEFKIYPSAFKRGEGKFCSIECYSTHNVGRNNSFFGKTHSDETRNKISKNHYDCSHENHPNWKGGPVKRKCKVCGKIFYVDQNVIERGEGCYCSHFCVRKNIVYPNHHTTPERIFEEICKQNTLPFHYVGNGQLWIGKKGKKQLNPDFIETTGKKVLVEVMGSYWHSPLLNRKLRESATLEYRKRHFRRYKWQPIFIWETDLMRRDAESFVLKLLERV